MKKVQISAKKNQQSAITLYCSQTTQNFVASYTNKAISQTTHYTRNNIVYLHTCHELSYIFSHE